MERCYFAKEGLKGDYNCSALIDPCEGFNPACKFYKTKEQYITQRDKVLTGAVKSVNAMAVSTEKRLVRKVMR